MHTGTEGYSLPEDRAWHVRNSEDDAGGTETAKGTRRLGDAGWEGSGSRCWCGQIRQLTLTGAAPSALPWMLSQPGFLPELTFSLITASFSSHTPLCPALPGTTACLVCPAVPFSVPFSGLLATACLQALTSCLNCSSPTCRLL